MRDAECDLADAGPPMRRKITQSLESRRRAITTILEVATSANMSVAPKKVTVDTKPPKGEKTCDSDLR
jgi:hypothetical protein